MQQTSCYVSSTWCLTALIRPGWQFYMSLDSDKISTVLLDNWRSFRLTSFLLCNRTWFALPLWVPHCFLAVFAHSFRFQSCISNWRIRLFWIWWYSSYSSWFLPFISPFWVFSGGLENRKYMMLSSREYAIETFIRFNMSIGRPAKFPIKHYKTYDVRLPRWFGP